MDSNYLSKIIKKLTPSQEPHLTRQANYRWWVWCREFVRPDIADKSRGSKGLVSADRSEAAALLGTTPRSIPKSSASDFAPLSTAEGFPRSRTRGLYSSSPEPRAQSARDSALSLAGASAGLPRLGRRRTVGQIGLKVRQNYISYELCD